MTVEVRESRFKGLPKQKAFLNAEGREVLYSGAWRAGKSLALALKCAQRAAHRGAREGLVRKELVTLKATTLRVLLKGDGQTPPVLPPGSYIHRKAECTIEILGGGEIVYFGMDDPDKRGSYSLTGVGMDEVVELTEDDYLMLLGRCSVRVDGLPNQLYGACNPGPPSHFLAARFGLSAGNFTPMPGCEAIQTCSFDNTFLSPEYLAILRTYTGLRQKRYVDGLWVGSEGLVYDQWDRQIHVMERHGPWARVIVAVDDGYTKPFAALRLCFDGDDRVHVEREVYQTKMQRSDKIAAVRSLADDAEAVVCDAASPELIAALSDEGFPAMSCDKTAGVFEQITQIVQPRLNDPGDGRPRLTVAPECEQTQTEFESYEWNPKKDAPIKELDHAMDALRYGLEYTDREPSPVRVVGVGEPGPEDEKGEEVSIGAMFEAARRDINFGFED